MSSHVVTPAMKAHRYLLLFVNPVLLCVLVAIGYYVAIHEHTSCLPVSHHSTVQTNFSSLLGEALSRVDDSSSSEILSPSPSASPTTSSGAMADEMVDADESSASNQNTLLVEDDSYSVGIGETILGSEVNDEYYQSMIDKVLTRMPTIHLTSAPTLYPTRSPTAPTVPTTSTQSPTLDPEWIPSLSPTAAPIEGPPIWTYDDIELVSGVDTSSLSETEIANRFWQGNSLMLQPDSDGTVILDLNYIQDVVVGVTSLTTCTLECVASKMTLEAPCSLMNSGDHVVINVTDILALRPLNSWNVYANSRMIKSNVKFGKLFLCAGERNVALPVKYDLAARGIRNRYDARIHHMQITTRKTSIDPGSYEWSNSQSSLEDASSVCYSVAVAFMDANSYGGYVGVVTLSHPTRSLRSYVHSSINKWSDSFVFARGITQIQYTNLEMMLLYPPENSLNDMDKSYATAYKYLSDFLTNTMFVQHTDMKVAVVGYHDMTLDNKVLIVRGRRYLISSILSNFNSSQVVYVDTADLEDPYRNIDKSFTYTLGGVCEEDAIVDQPWFLQGWCENNDENHLQPKIGFPRLKAPIGWRAVQQLFNSTVKSVWPVVTDTTVESNTSEDGNQYSTVHIQFSNPVQTVQDLYTPYTDLYKWSALSGAYGSWASSQLFLNNETSVSSDGLVLSIRRINQAFVDDSIATFMYAESVGGCCNQFAEYGIESLGEEYEVCPPMSCGISLADTPYITVHSFYSAL